MMCSSFCSIVTCLFESILMPKSWMQECYKLLGVDSCQSMRFCHFCYICCVLHMGMSSTYVLIYAMSSLQRCLPCIFVIIVVTSTSICKVAFVYCWFQGLRIPLSHCSAVIFMPCIHDATVRSMLVLSCFSKDDFDIWLCSIHPCLCLQLWSTLE